MLETLRERLLSVQQDFTSGLKTLSDKSREAKVKSTPRTVSYLPKYSAGLELLNRYEDTWAALHKRAKECAHAGELVDSEVVMLSAHWEKKKTSLIELQEQLQQLPGLIADLESMTTNLTHLEASFEEVENHLLNLEDLCAQCELERYKHAQSQQLENYKKNKRRCTSGELPDNWRFHLTSTELLFSCSVLISMSSPGLKENRQRNASELDAEHSRKVLEMEHTQQMKLKERQKFFEEAFQQDMEQYLSTGYLQIAERREPMGSMSSMEVNIDMLEQMDLMDVSDQEALDVFLNSGGEDNAMPSPVLGPESSIGQNEISLQVPNPSELQAKTPSLSSACTDPSTQDPSEGGESPVVQSDEEGVEVDTALATLHTDDSDS
ncbi:dysbindin isoform X1 [Rousettus aegyptiacus]|uniref:Dystrobrevin binding protein 1 n=3 Tax=Rousettus aegyptiacus TaxID=9407 RepID=A0A7J8K7B4_ROUAE|nr:dysbindin isoform X1 [Rousettus aegyptiacus]KAF6504755.1 dystrobrevin binding protein 1 [Rousettus aegyptiacus]